MLNSIVSEFNGALRDLTGGTSSMAGSMALTGAVVIAGLWVLSEVSG